MHRSQRMEYPDSGRFPTLVYIYPESIMLLLEGKEPTDLLNKALRR